MRKTKKTAVIVALCLIVVGLLVLAAGFALSGGGHINLDAENVEINTYTVEEDFSDIVMENVSANVRFTQAEDGTCRVVCRENEMVSYTVSIEEGALVVRETDHRKWYHHIGIFFSDREIEIYLPRETYGCMDVDTSVGRIEIGNTFSFETVEIESDTGDIVFAASVEKLMAIFSDTGSITVTDAGASALKLETATGAIRAIGVKVEEKAEIKSDTGAVAVTEMTCQNAFLETKTGKIVLEDTTVEKELRIRSDTGDVEILESDACALKIQTDTGDVRGTLLTEKVFLVESDTGDIAVPKTTQGGSCEVSTDTGNITFTVLNGTI